jgi:hypothetical protein
MLLTGALMMLVCVTLAFSIGTLAPSYTMWGHQQYLLNGTLVPCDTLAPPTNCSMTQLERITSVVKFKFGFFRYVLYWSNWVFLAFWVLGLILAICLRVKGEFSQQQQKKSILKPHCCFLGQGDLSDGEADDHPEPRARSDRF